MEGTESVAAVADAPVSTPASAPSGESAAPAATPSTPTAKPASMKEALTRTAEKRAGQQGAPTTAAPASPDGQPAKKGPIPFDVHETTLKNAREKASAEAVAAWKDYEFVRQLPAQDAREFYDLAIRHRGNPVGMLQELASHIANDPEHAKALRSFVGQQLAASRGSQPAAVPPPDLEVLGADGQVVSRTYSEHGIAKLIAHVQRQTVEELRKEFAPVKQTHEQIQEAQRLSAEQREVQAWSAELGKDMNTWPGFHPEQNKAERAAVKARVAALVEALPLAKQRDATVLENVLQRAYREIVIPKLSQMGSASTLASLKQKAIAQVESPSGSAPVSTTRPKNPRELAKLLEEKAARRATR